MKNYELTLILDGKATAAKRKGVVEKVTKLIKTFDGKMEKVQEWGSRELNYKIGKSLTGFFLHMPLQLTAESAKVLPQRLRTEDEIIRFLIIRAE